MLSLRQINILIQISLALLFVANNINAQEDVSELAVYDTTEYIPLFFNGAVDYNLMIAASKGYSGEINRLINQGADIFADTDEGVTPLIFAISGNHTEAALLLIKLGSDINKKTTKGDYPLHIAVKNQNEEISEALIRAGADIDVTDKYNATPLHYASVYGYIQIVDMLLYYEASIDNKTADGSTPLFASIWAGNADIADLLIQNGASISARDNEGFTPFLMAALNGDTIIMNLLYNRGADIYAVNNVKNSALNLTIIANKTLATKYLLRIGNKWTDKSIGAVNPLYVASKYQRKEIIQILEDHKTPGNIRYAIDQMGIAANVRLVPHEIYTGLSLSLKEPLINGGIIFGCDFKPFYSRVLVKQSDRQYYQYFEKGSVVYSGLFKNIALTNNPFRPNYELSASLSMAYTFGNIFKGTDLISKNKFLIMPSLAIKWVNKDYSFSFGAEYLKTDFYRIGPVWLRLGACYNLYFDNVRIKAKTLKWY